MDLESELARFAHGYEQQGYEVTIRPGSGDLPPFAADFKVEILARRGNDGVLVAVKKDWDELAADQGLTSYARVTAEQPGWRFDLAVVEQAKPNLRDINGARDFSKDDIDRVFSQSEEMVEHGYVGGAVVSAWGAFESSMRMKLRADGKKAGWGSSPRSMLSELYSSGSIGTEELPKLETLYRVRNQITHGFLADLASEAGSVAFLRGVGHRLIEESLAVTDFGV